MKQIRRSIIVGIATLTLLTPSGLLGKQNNKKHNTKTVAHHKALPKSRFKRTVHKTKKVTKKVAKKAKGWFWKSFYAVKCVVTWPFKKSKK
jgi:hypothetical protein